MMEQIQNKSQEFENEAGKVAKVNTELEAGEASNGEAAADGAASAGTSAGAASTASTDLNYSQSQ